MPQRGAAPCVQGGHCHLLSAECVGHIGERDGTRRDAPRDTAPDSVTTRVTTISPILDHAGGDPLQPPRQRPRASCTYRERDGACRVAPCETAPDAVGPREAAAARTGARSEQRQHSASATQWSARRAPVARAGARVSSTCRPCCTAPGAVRPRETAVSRTGARVEWQQHSSSAPHRPCAPCACSGAGAPWHPCPPCRPACYSTRRCSYASHCYSRYQPWGLPAPCTQCAPCLSASPSPSLPLPSLSLSIISIISIHYISPYPSAPPDIVIQYIFLNNTAHCTRRGLRARLPALL